MSLGRGFKRYIKGSSSLMLIQQSRGQLPFLLVLVSLQRCRKTPRQVRVPPQGAATGLNQIHCRSLSLRLRNAATASSGLALKSRHIELLEMIISNLPLEKSSRPSIKNDDTTNEDDQISDGGLYKSFEMETNPIESSSRFEGISKLVIEGLEGLELHVLANQRFEQYNDGFYSGGGQYKFYSVKSTSAKS
ncbi:hypothetical protein ACFX1Z_024488 [Malus domestica]